MRDYPFKPYCFYSLMKRTLLIFVVVLLGVLYYYISVLPVYDNVEIARVVDGDTVELRNRSRCRHPNLRTNSTPHKTTQSNNQKITLW